MRMFLVYTIAALAAATENQVSVGTISTQVRSLREQVAAQQKQIEELRLMLERQQKLLDTLTHVAPQNVTEPRPSGSGFSPQAPDKRLDEVSRGLAGFKFSGDFRYRLDMQLRSANDVAGPLQNVRSRYRLRLNMDKDLDRRFGFHMQLSTGPYHVQTTNDQDMAGMAAKHPFSVAEAYVDFHPHARFSMRGGRMEEVFADGMRFLWDDDVRFNGFQQITRIPLGSALAGFKRLELRAGEYILSNPAVYVLPLSSPYAGAGFQPGRKVRDAQLFHPGFLLQGDLGSRWAHQIVGDVQLYRNANQIQLSSTAQGVPILVSNALGVQLPLPIPTTGNATTAPGGAMFSARHFQVARLAWRLERKGIVLAGREMPAWFDFQVARNVGAGALRDGLMASANLGAVRKFGDTRFLYQFALKDANALISQFTDDDLGTGTGVNLRVHALRFDLGLTRSLQWQNLLFIQNQRRASNPAAQFFVPLQRGANETFRYLGQLAFSF